MPEMRFDVKWPSGESTRCYSPSLVVFELLDTRQYPVFEFLERARAGLNIGSERVRLRFGFYCSAAQDQLRELEALATRFKPEDMVQVTGLYAENAPMPPLSQRSLDGAPDSGGEP